MTASTLPSTLRILLDEHGAELVELDDMGPSFVASLIVLDDGTVYLFAPIGQDPDVRERTARRLLTRPRGDA